jgi:hypothetical protein
VIRTFLSFTLVAVGLVLVGLASQGCGNAGAQDASIQAKKLPPLVDPAVVAYKKPTAQYTKILEELRRAAKAGKNYEAPHLAKHLGPVEKSVVKWFCQTAWQMVVNKELDRLPDEEYLAHRLSVRSILEVSDHLYTKSGRAPYLSPVEVGVSELDRVIDLHSFDAKQDRRYEKSCDGGWKST